MRKAAYFLIIWFILSSGISPLAAGMSKKVGVLNGKMGIVYIL